MIQILAQLTFLTAYVQAHLADHGASIKLTIPSNPRSFPIRDANPLGLSLEFWEFPSYMTKVKQTTQCLLNLELAYGAPLAIRIGGTSQDHSVFDPKEKEAIRSKFEPSVRAPLNSTFGLEFIRLASKFTGPTTLGLNRQMDNLNNVVAATEAAIEQIKNLDAIELGNEPEYWGSKSPVAKNRPWNPETDAVSQSQWQQALSQKVKKKELIQAGVYLAFPTWSISALASKLASNSEYIKSFGRHAYPQTVCGGAKTDLASLMLHTKVEKFVKRYEQEVEMLNKFGKPLHFSETNSATCEGGEMSKTFGAALWLIDFVFQSLIIGVHRLYFHQATISYSRYNFWNFEKVAAPYYGAYFTALALQNASHISILQTSKPSVAAYVLYRCLRIIRVVVYHSDLRTPKSNQPDENVSLAGLPPRIKSARLLRFTAPDALVSETGRDGPQIGKSYFDNASCKLSATPQYEKLTLQRGAMSFNIRASEALLIEFNDGEIKTCPNSLTNQKD